MKKIIPFKKDILFKTNLAEIISISLDHKLEEEGNFVKGEFTVSGEYKMLETSINTEEFSYTLPFTVDLDERYILDDVDIDIDDFYYEIINDNMLSVHIDVSIDKIKEKPVLEEKEIIREQLPIEEAEDNIDDYKEETREVNKIEEKEVNKMEETREVARCIEPETPPKERTSESIFSSISETKETYKSYIIYIVREDDNLDSIIQKYSTSREYLELYNDLSELKIGDKIIIPTND